MIETTSWDQSHYFNTTFLKQYDQVAQELIQHDGFQTGYLETCQDVRLHYLWKKRTNARCTVICCAGFWPGRKEGMATLYSLLPEDCNILLFDSRGRGKSSGGYYAFWRYGMDEYKDVIAAIDFAQEKDSCRIILYGICAGAFHAAHAVAHEEKSRVCGLIFDSGWSSVSTASYTGFTGDMKKNIGQVIKNSTAYPLIESLVARMGLGIAQVSMYLFHTFLCKPTLYFYHNHTNLLEKINLIAVPILYIHAYDDDRVDIAAVKQLAKHSQKPHCWWIEKPSCHAAHHLKHKHEYRKKLIKFLDFILY